MLARLSGSSAYAFWEAFHDSPVAYIQYHDYKKKLRK
jgi:hypothetical protein